MSAHNVIIIPEKPEVNRQSTIRQEQVAAYCRVSTEEEEQYSSYENQCNREYHFMLMFLDADLTEKRIVFLPHTFGAEIIRMAATLRAGIFRGYVAGQQPHRILLLHAPGFGSKSDG